MRARKQLGIGIYLKRNFSTQKRNLEAQMALHKNQKGDCECEDTTKQLELEGPREVEQ